MSRKASPPISGFVTKEFEGVRREFARNFARRRALYRRLAVEFGFGKM